MNCIPNKFQTLDKFCERKNTQIVAMRNRTQVDQ